MEEELSFPIPLHRLRSGTYCSVLSLHVPDAMRYRLQALGLIAGTKIQCLENPKNRPMLLYIRGACIALRQSDAQNILVRVYIQT